MFSRPIEKGGSLTRQIVNSMAVHGLLAVGILSTIHAVRQREPYRLPGTVHGLHMLTYYSAGSKVVSDATLAKRESTLSERTPPSEKTQRLRAAPSAHALAEKGPGKSPMTGLGNGNVNIALLKYFPYPDVPLPHGTNGNVIFDAVIDEHGVISSLTVEKSITAEIDAAVAAIVKTWTFQPATQGGVAVASEQSLIFHFEKT